MHLNIIRFFSGVRHRGGREREPEHEGVVAGRADPGDGAGALRLRVLGAVPARVRGEVPLLRTGGSGKMDICMFD